MFCKFLTPHILGGGLLFLIEHLIGLYDLGWLFAITVIGYWVSILAIQSETLWFGHLTGLALTLTVITVPIFKKVNEKNAVIINWIFASTQFLMGTLVVLGSHY